MKDIDGGRELLRLNLVGTHDCVTKYVQFSHISKCQNLDIYSQLCLGVRGLDIRVQSKGDRLGMVHGIAKAYNSPCRLSRQMDMADVLGHCYRFLDENPSEAIVFQFKNDSGKEMEKCFDNLFFTYINDIIIKVRINLELNYFRHEFFSFVTFFALFVSVLS